VSSDEVMVFLRRDEQWLVLHRSERQGSYWHSVAGGVEAGESDAAAAARELHEEVGLLADPVDVGVSFVYTPEAWESRFRRPDVSYRVACFLVEAPSAWEPELDWEHDTYRWCSLAEALELLRWPEPRRVLEAIA
jgi:8-oxo-dGTP pyrophosphatase MutT (NUDIX family)